MSVNAKKVEVNEMNVEEKNMYAQKQQENKKQNKKAGIIFAVLIMLGMFMGLMGGIASDNIATFLKERNLTDTVGDVLTEIIGQGSPFVIILLFIISLLYSVVIYRKCKAKWNVRKDTDEEIFDEIEESLSNVLNVTSLGTIIVYGFFAAGFYYMMYVEFTVWFAISILFFIAYMIYTVVCQQKIIDFTKIMNPEKQGSVYDMKFQDKWYESCDEMERIMIGKCAMKAFRVTQNLCVFLWMIFVFVGMIFEISLWPVVIVTFIWFVLTFTYAREAKKLTKLSKTE